MSICSICLENINNNCCTTDCGHSYHGLCILGWLSRDGKICPLCNGNIIIKDFDNIYLKKKYFHKSFCNINIIINLVKIKINDLDYFLSIDDSKIYFTIFTSINYLDYLEEIGFYDWNSKTIIYKYYVKKYEIKNNNYLISTLGEIFDYRTHILLKKYENNDINSIINDLNNNLLKINNNADIFIGEECNDSEDFVIKGYYYFKGQVYDKETNNNIPLTPRILGI